MHLLVSQRLLDDARSGRDPGGEVDALCMLSRVALRNHDYQQVAERAGLGLEVARRAGDRRLEQMPLHMQAAAARMSGDPGRARGLYEQSISLSRELGDERMAAAELRNLAYVEFGDGRVARARELFWAARAQARRLGYQALLPHLVADAAVLAAEDGDPCRAAELLGAAQAAFLASGEIPDPDDDAEHERLRSRLVEELGSAFEPAYSAGTSLSLQEALDNT